MTNVNARFDWSPETSLFIVRKPTATHEMFKMRVVDEISSQLANAARKNERVAVVFDSIISKGCSDVRLLGVLGHGSIDNKYPQKSPDAAFGSVDAQ